MILQSSDENVKILSLLKEIQNATETISADEASEIFDKQKENEDTLENMNEMFSGLSVEFNEEAEEEIKQLEKELGTDATSTNEIED